MNKTPKAIMITGASRGLGRALALEYAAKEITLVLTARNKEKLREVASVCTEKGAEVVTGIFDLREFDKASGFLKKVDRDISIDLLIANAGVYSGIGQDGEMESAAAVATQIEINLTGTIVLVNSMASRMMGRKTGHIAIISSLGAVRAMADAPAYSASKSGLLAYGEALREFLDDHGVSVSVVLPGHVKTDQTLVHSGKLPAILSPQKAAQIIRQRLDKKRSIIAFPAYLYLLVRLEKILPWRLRAIINRPYRFYVEKTKK